MKSKGTVTISIEDYDNLRNLRKSIEDKMFLTFTEYGGVDYSHSYSYYYETEELKKLAEQLDKLKDDSATEWVDNKKLCKALATSRRARIKYRKEHGL